jgi:hypothetical protein
MKRPEKPHQVTTDELLAQARRTAERRLWPFAGDEHDDDHRRDDEGTREHARKAGAS